MIVDQLAVISPTRGFYELTTELRQRHTGNNIKVATTFEELTLFECGINRVNASLSSWQPSLKPLIPSRNRAPRERGRNYLAANRPVPAGREFRVTLRYALRALLLDFFH
jgi:hypothetical protein